MKVATPLIAATFVVSVLRLEVSPVTPVEIVPTVVVSEARLVVSVPTLVVSVLRLVVSPVTLVWIAPTVVVSEVSPVEIVPMVV